MKTKLGSKKTVGRKRKAKPAPRDLAPIARHIDNVLADNLGKLLKHHKLPQSFLAGRANGVSQATIGRIQRCEVKTSIEQVALIARYFGLEAWQILVDPFDAASPPRLLTAEELARMLVALQVQALTTSEKAADSIPV